MKMGAPVHLGLVVCILKKVSICVDQVADVFLCFQDEDDSHNSKRQRADMENEVEIECR